MGVKKREKNIALAVVNGTMTKAEASRKLKISTQAVDTRLFNALADIIREGNFTK